MKKIVEVAHKFIAEHQDLDIAVDFTCGNGYDTKFLSECCHQVYAFDIQEDAIAKAKTIAQRSNIEWILDDHANVDQHVGAFDVGVFNLGYLPGGDESITTNADSVITALDKALQIAHKPALIIIVLYPGFEHGKKEAKAIEAYVEKLDSKHYDVSILKLLNRKDAPYIISIDVKGEDEAVPFTIPFHLIIGDIRYSLSKTFVEFNKLDSYDVQKVMYKDLLSVTYVDQKRLSFTLPSNDTVTLDTSMVKKEVLKDIYMCMYLVRKRNGINEELQSEIQLENC